MTVTYADLFNLDSDAWTSRVIDPSACVADGVTCSFDGVGSTWIRFTSSGGASAATSVAPVPTYLQNIATGAVRAGAFFPGDPTTSDDLDNATGVAHPCTGSAPALDDDFFGTPQTNGSDPHFAQLGHFVLRTGASEEKNPRNILQACDSRTRTVVPQGFVATANMVFWTRNPRMFGESQLAGISLPGLRPLLIPDNKGPLAAASNTTLYETTTDSSSNTTLWAATVPKASLTGR